MKSLRLCTLLTGVAFLIFTTGCRKDIPDDKNETSLQAAQYNADVVLSWYKLYETIDRYAPGYRPPAAARAMGYTGLAGYEAALPGMPFNKSMQNQFAGLSLPFIETDKEYHWPMAVNAAYHYMFEKFYPHIRAIDREDVARLFTNYEKLFREEHSSEVIDRSRAFGEAVASAIFKWSATDGNGHEAYLNPRPSSYTPPSGPGLWQPTFPDYSPALFPYWGKVRPFAMKQDELKAKPPIPWSEDENSMFFNQVRETQIWTDRVRKGNDPESYWIAIFWSDDFGDVTFTPPGRWMAIANQVVEAEKPSLDRAVELYAKLGMSLNDVAIGVWNSKYIYNLERPFHVIRRKLDPDWETVMNHPQTGLRSVTPEFPAYPSGHSGFGGAAAPILAEFFGHNYSMTDKCHQYRYEFQGTPRSFNSFQEMAVENAYSRVPLGVHFRMDCDEGLRMGNLAAKRVQELPWK